MPEIDVKALRQALGLTQTELAQKIGVNQVTVNRWENRRGKPSKLAQRELARLQRKIQQGVKN